jgi:Ca2+-binding EF-hand superfamily protein
MILRKLALSTLVFGILGATGAALAQTPPASSVAELRAWDADQDGTIDLAEAKKAGGAKFDSLDADRDGTLDMGELASAKVSKATFSKADLDKDGTLSKDEYLALVEARFNRADKDHDGTVSAAELKTKSGHALAALLN